MDEQKRKKACSAETGLLVLNIFLAFCGQALGLFWVKSTESTIIIFFYVLLIRSFAKLKFQSCNEITWRENITELSTRSISFFLLYNLNVEINGNFIIALKKYICRLCRRPHPTNGYWLFSLDFSEYFPLSSLILSRRKTNYHTKFQKSVFPHLYEQQSLPP